MKRALKRILSVVLCFSLVVSGGVSLGLSASAATGEYYYDANNNRTGIISVLNDDGVRYFDIADGGMLVDKESVPEFYIKALTKEYGGTSVARMWANIASLVFEDAGHGVGYSFPPSVGDGVFDRLFTKTDTSDTFECDVNLIEALSSTQPYSSGSMSDPLLSQGCASSTGLTYFSSLEAVQGKMAELIVNNVPSASLYTKEELLEKTTGNKTGFDVPDKGDGQPVIAAVASSMYPLISTTATSFAIAFYDFELVPFIAEGVPFITAAEEYESVGEAAAANAPGVKFNSSTTEEAFVSYTTNPSRSSAETSVSFSETSSVSVSNSMESSHSHTYGHSVGVGVELGLSFDKIGLSLGGSVNYGFTTQDTVGTAYGESNSLSESTTKTATAQISLPAHTKIGISQQKSESEVVLDYSCPVYITYKVAIMSIGGVGLDYAGLESPEHSALCTVFGTSETLKGVTAIENLNKRAIQYLDMPSFEESQYFYASDEAVNGIDWQAIIDTTQTNGDKSARECVKWLSGNVPLSAAGANLTLKQNGVETKLTDIKPLYDLTSVTAGDTTSYSLARGGAIDLYDISTQGYNQYGVPYYGYMPLMGEWSVCDANGNAVTDEDGVTLEKTTYTQILTANETGDYYLKYSIDENTYTYVTDDTKYIKNSDLSIYPIIKISVTNTGENHTCIAGDWKTTIPATCFMEGARVKVCETCGIQMESETIAKSAHTPVEVTVPATCTQGGSVTEACGVCGTVISSETTDAAGHGEGMWRIDFEATQDHDGQMSEVCKVCGEVLSVKEFSLHTHEFGYESVLKSATCIAEGEKGLFCKVCNAMYKTEKIEKSGHGAAVSVISVAPTCTEKGEKVTYCSDCGLRIGVTSVDATGHDDGVWKVDYEATADHNGQMSLYCSKCNEVLDTKEFPIHKHEFGYKEIIRPATCVVDGVEGSFCSVCGGCYETQPVPANGHGEKITLTTIKPTCTEKGEKVTYCSDCGLMIGVVSVDATGHDDGVWKVDYEATADHNGQMSLYCSKCGEVLDTKEFTLHNHKAGHTTVLSYPTCTQDGEKATYCSICGAWYDTQTVAAKGHGETYEVITVSATCTEAGEKTVYCSDCNGAVGTEKIDPHGHSGETYTVSIKPTCQSAGEEILSCETCGETIGKRVLPASGHTGVWLTVEEATCTKYGREEKTCTACGTVLETKRIAKEEHVPGKWEITQQSSCTQSGLKQQTCAVCSALLGDPVVIEPHEHQAGEWVTVLEPDCENDGEKVKNCTVCGGTVASEIIPALGHTEGTWVTAVEAACESKGEEHLICNRCGYVIDRKDIAALGHKFSEWHTNNNSTHSRTCLNCNNTETNNCDYVVTATPSTCTEGGYSTNTCSVCKHTYVDKYTDALGHAWSEWTDCGDGENHSRTCSRCKTDETQAHSWSEWKYNDDGTAFCDGTKTKECEHCDASQTETAEHTSTFGRIFYGFIVFIGNIVHKLIYIISLNWLFPELTITPEF